MEGAPAPDASGSTRSRRVCEAVRVGRCGRSCAASSPGPFALRFTIRWSPSPFRTPHPASICRASATTTVQCGVAKPVPQRMSPESATCRVCSHERTVLERIALHQTRLHTPGLGLDAQGRRARGQGPRPAAVDRPPRGAPGGLHARALARGPDAEPGDARRPVEARHARDHARVRRRVERPHGPPRRDGAPGRAASPSPAPRATSCSTATRAPRSATTRRSSCPRTRRCALYHDRFSQTYDVERALELRPLLLRLMPRVDPSTKLEPGMRSSSPSRGSGRRSCTTSSARASRARSASRSGRPRRAFDDAPVRRWVLRIPELPERMRALVHDTPGITAFVPAGAGVAVEAGYRHPVELRACPVFDAAGSCSCAAAATSRGSLPRLPPMGALTAFARVELRTTGVEAAVASRDGAGRGGAGAAPRGAVDAPRGGT